MDVGDDNDNVLEVLLVFLVNFVLENILVGIVVGLFNVRDRDLGKNSEVSFDIFLDLLF